MLRRADQPDMRRKLGKNLTISPDAKRVRFGLEEGGDLPWMFDTAELSFKPSASSPTDLHQPDTTALNVEGWRNAKGRYPLLNGKELPEAPGFVNVGFFGLAIAPDAANFTISTEWHLINYDAAGQVRWIHLAPGPAHGGQRVNERQSY